MKAVGEFTLKRGKEVIQKEHPEELKEIYEVIASVNADKCLTKESKEKTKKGQMLYNPKQLNKMFKKEFEKRGWEPHKVKIDYYKEYYLPGYTPHITLKNAYREMDFVKNKVGVEVQFGKYAFMVYNVAAKMTIFKKLGIIDVGVEIVPTKEMQQIMSTGVSFFEQFVWDLKNRGVADIDIPVLVLGIIPESLTKQNSSQKHLY